MPPHPSARPPRLPSDGQFGAQQPPLTAMVPLGHGQVPPHPSGLPFCEPSGGQTGVQQAPACSTWPLGQPQVALHPSSRPARLPSDGQFGVQTQVPCTQRPEVPQPLGPQSQVSAQTPLLQVLPGAHLTPAQLLATQRPPAQTCPAAHEMPAHGSGGTQVSAQALPAPQRASQAVNGAHAPVFGWQVCPAGQITPLHGVGKQPATQAPATQVSFLPHVMPAQGSWVGTQAAAQVVPAAQPAPASVAQGSG